MNVEDFYNEYVDKVYRFFYIKCLDRHIAEDLTADTFTAYIAKQQLVDINDQKKYLYGVMRTVWIEYLKRKYTLAVSAVENIENFEDHVATELESDGHDEQPNLRIIDFINRLPDKQRAVMTLRSVEEKSVAETAAELGKDKNYVKTTHHRAILNLRKLLSEPYNAEKEFVV